MSYPLTTKAQVTAAISQNPEFYTDISGIVADYADYGCSAKTERGSRCFYENNGCELYCIDNTKRLKVWLLPLFQWLDNSEFSISVRNKVSGIEKTISTVPLITPDNDRQEEISDLEIVPFTFLEEKSVTLSLIDLGNSENEYAKFTFASILANTSEYGEQIFSITDTMNLEFETYDHFAQLLPQNVIVAIENKIDDYSNNDMGREVKDHSDFWGNEFYNNALIPIIATLIQHSIKPFRLVITLECDGNSKLDIFKLFENAAIEDFVNQNYDIGIPNVIEPGFVKFTFDSKQFDKQSNWRFTSISSFLYNWSRGLKQTEHS